MISSEPKTEHFTWNRLLGEEGGGEGAELQSSLHNANSTGVLPKDTNVCHLNYIWHNLYRDQESWFIIKV